MLRLCFAIWLCSAGLLHAQCRQALALGLDVSGSVDEREYRLQMEGLAAAFNSAPVRSALLAQPNTPVEVLVFEWSGPEDQLTIFPWSTLKTHDDLDDLVATLQDTQRRDTSPGTALGAAMQVGARHLQHTSCWTKTLDISGDGQSNLGPRPRDVKTQLSDTGITINALVVGSDTPTLEDTRHLEISELSDYFTAEVILGTDAFVETSVGFAGYRVAMQRKLEKEIENMQLSRSNQESKIHTNSPYFIE